ncbi:MAG: hypothetical protein IPP16_11055 [Acidimicrobiaceae bacterium]|nr:hypothetical protein [Acidimicrobiaceae bacterium]
MFFVAPSDCRRQASARNTIRQRFGMLRSFFDRIIEWDWDDAPQRIPIFSVDVPVADDPLPRFLDDVKPPVSPPQPRSPRRSTGW